MHKSSLPIVAQMPSGMATTFCLVGSVASQGTSQIEQNVKPLAKLARAPGTAGVSVPCAHSARVAAMGLKQQGRESPNEQQIFPVPFF